ncbi:MAG: hypothetical protein LBD44_02120, partial [Spirochaetaceae bacterium]|nr:hypothetical protein [Spirochaetaceae bacterium]
IGATLTQGKQSLPHLRNEPPRSKRRGGSFRKEIYHMGVYYHFLSVLLILTAASGGVLNPKAE